MKPTSIMQLLNITEPVICAPLGRGSTPQFLATLKAAGTIGFVALAHMEPQEIGLAISKISSATNGHFGVNFSLISDQRDRLRRALDAGARVVSFWQDDPTEYVQIAKDAGATVLWTVGKSEDAARARDVGVDALVVQGSEAGGHLVGQSGLMSLLPAVVDASNGIPVAAAGGIADGRGVAAAFALGAEAVWLGSRFVASREVALHEGYKQRIVEAKASDTVETRLFDIEWEDSLHRVLRNWVFEQWETSGKPAPGKRPEEGKILGRQPDGTIVPIYHVSAPASQFEGDWSGTALYAGSSVQLIHEILSVEEIINDMKFGASQAAQRAACLI